MNLSGKWLIRTKVNEETGKVSYRTTIVNTTVDGEKEYATLFLRMVKDAKLKGIDDKTYIEVKPEDAWLSFYKTEDENGNVDITFVATVKDFEIVGEKVDVNEVEGNTDDDLPF